MIVAHKLTKSFGSIRAIQDVSVSVRKGEICGILGPNGSGKSTLFKILCNLVTPDFGSFEINSKKAKPIGAIIEKPALFEYLSAYKNISMLSKIQGAPHDEKTILKSLERVGLPIERKDSVRNFSLGMKQRLGIAVALLNDPDCLILDEPFLGLDPLGMKSLRLLIKELAHTNKLAILISSHLLEELSRTCDMLNVIQHGKIVQCGTTKAILNLHTKTYEICGKNLSKSKLLQGRNMLIDGDCITIELSVNEAPVLLQDLVREGNKITFFSPETNLNKLYEGR